MCRTRVGGKPLGSSALWKLHLLLHPAFRLHKTQSYYFTMAWQDVMAVYCGREARLDRAIKHRTALYTFR